MDWVVQYWVEVLFGVIAAGFGVLAKKFWTMYKNEQERNKEIDIEQCYQKVRKDILGVETKMAEREDMLLEKIKTTNDNSYVHDVEIKEDIDALKAGILVIEGAYFTQECELLLNKDGIITVEEFKKLTADHAAYNRLGGNHTGDQLYRSVEQKFNTQHL